MTFQEEKRKKEEEEGKKKYDKRRRSTKKFIYIDYIFNTFFVYFIKNKKIKKIYLKIKLKNH